MFPTKIVQRAKHLVWVWEEQHRKLKLINILLFQILVQENKFWFVTGQGEFFYLQQGDIAGNVIFAEGHPGEIVGCSWDG